MKAPCLKLRGTFAAILAQLAAAACVLALCAVANPKKYDGGDSSDPSEMDYR